MCYFSDKANILTLILVLFIFLYYSLWTFSPSLSLYQPHCRVFLYFMRSRISRVPLSLEERIFPAQPGVTAVYSVSDNLRTLSHHFFHGVVLQSRIFSVSQIICQTSSLSSRRMDIPMSQSLVKLTMLSPQISFSWLLD